MPEDIEETAGATTVATAPEDSSYSKILEGQATEPINAEASAKTEEKTTLEASEQPAQTSEEVILEIGGKEYSIKQADLLDYLANQSKHAEREKSLTEKEKSLNRDYTQKSQQVAEFRKSLEGSFGGKLPEVPMLKALGTVYQRSFQNPEYAAALNAMLEGKSLQGVLSKGASTQEQGKAADPYVSQLEGQILELKEQLGQFTQSFTEREESQRMGEAQKTWQSWADEKSKAGFKVTDEIDAKMAPFITALKAANPDWEPRQILDTAFKHATIDDIEKTTAAKVLQSADKAKQTTIPRIKPKGSAQSDSDKSYKDIFLNK